MTPFPPPADTGTEGGPSVLCSVTGPSPPPLTRVQKEEARQSAEDQERQLASVRLAYQDLSLEQRKQTDRVKNLDPKKAEQLERLGMGFGGTGSGYAEGSGEGGGYSC